jgi:hypothetical protein
MHKQQSFVADQLYPMRALNVGDQQEVQSYAQQATKQEQQFGRDIMQKRMEEERIQKEQAAIKRKELEEKARHVKEHMNKQSDEQIRKRQEADQKVMKMYGWQENHDEDHQNSHHHSNNHHNSHNYDNHYEQQQQNYNEFDSHQSHNQPQHFDYANEYAYQEPQCYQENYYAEQFQHNQQYEPSPPKLFNTENVENPWSDSLKTQQHIKKDVKEPEKPFKKIEEKTRETKSREKIKPSIKEEDNGTERRHFEIRPK